MVGPLSTYAVWRYPEYSDKPCTGPQKIEKGSRRSWQSNVMAEGSGLSLENFGKVAVICAPRRRCVAQCAFSARGRTKVQGIQDDCRL